MKRPRVVLADDHRLLREAFAQLLEPSCDVLAAVADGRALIEAAHGTPARDRRAGRGDAAPQRSRRRAQLRGRLPDIRLIFLTVSEDPDIAAEAFRAGASGFLLKNSAASELIKAIQEVSQGRSYVTPIATQGLVDSLIREPGAAAGARPLSRRRREVLQLLAEGRTMKEIAPLPGDHAADRRLPQIRHDGGAGDQDERELVQYAIKHHIVSP